MDKDKLLAILHMVSDGKLDPSEALDKLKTLPFEDIGFAKVDQHRALRQGMPEVIFCPGKTPEQIAQVALRLRQHHTTVLASRASAEQAAAVLGLVPDCTYHELGKMLVFGQLPMIDDSLPRVGVLTAGTADLPVAEECALVLQARGVPLLRLNDVGVAGIHRLLHNLDELQNLSATIVIAGMDGALPSVVAGLLAGPVVAVPTSVGYGAGANGIAPLLTMLNSCAAGLTVVNIDNGFGAAMAILRLIAASQSQNASPANRSKQEQAG